jgi:hypothetical protein
VIAVKEPVTKVFGTLDSSNLSFHEKKYSCDINDAGEEGNILAVGTLAGTYTYGD